MAVPQQPTHIEFENMSDEQKADVIGQVAISLRLTSDDPPPDETIAEIALDLMEHEPAFQTWPLGNRAGGQTAYLESLHLRVMEVFKKPVQQEEGVADAYVNSHAKLPGDLPAAGISQKAPPEDE